MKQVMCNVLYSAVIPVWGKELGSVNVDLGYFEQKRDASIASNVVARILCDNAKDFSILAIEDFDVAETYVPESQMSQPKIKNNFYRTIDDFASKNTYTIYLSSKSGSRELNRVIDETTKDYDKDIERQKKYASQPGAEEN